jgi:K+-sensing histidine kinase KdpD
MIRSTHRIRQALDRFTDMVHLMEPSVSTGAHETQEEVDLVPLICGVAETLADNHKRREDLCIRLRSAVAAGKRDYIQTALRELIDNAFRHTKSGTRVIITAHSTISGIRVMVGDRGNGFGDWVLDGRLRETEPRDVFTHKKPGIGLGLAQLACWAIGGTCTFANARRGGALVRLDFCHALPADRYLQ